jgi:hypothetical protein
MHAVIAPSVIPDGAKRRSGISMSSARFRVRRCAAPRNDVLLIAMTNKAKRNNKETP